METMICMSLEENSTCVPSTWGKEKKQWMLELLNLLSQGQFQRPMFELKTRITDLIGRFLSLS